MKFDKAVDKMRKGFKIQAGWYLKHDYLYLENGKIMCDGGFEYTLSYKELKTKTWRIYDSKQQRSKD